jgi:DNA polymerase-3 subunit epsilon
MIPGRVAFLDLETTGTDPRADRVTEIGLVLADDGVVTEEWSTLVNPGRAIPPGIERITGIGDEMVSDAPGFEQIAGELASRLAARLLVAHNARFDHSFLRSEFTRAGLRLHCPVLCTVRLSRRLFPQQVRHNLDALVERYRLPCDTRHRALPDARALYHLVAAFGQQAGMPALRAAIEAQQASPHAPPGIDADLFDDVPDAPGSYLLYDAQGAALYAGRAANLRTRLLGHLRDRGRHAQEQRAALIAGALEWFPAAGELGAALRHYRLLESLAPRHNRRPRQRREAWVLAWRPETAEAPVAVVDLNADEAVPGEGTIASGDWYGPFRSRADAMAALRGLAREHRLCATAVGLEGAAPCSARAHGQCGGLCTGDEKPAAHALRLMQALSRLRMRPWPWPGAVALAEQDPAHTRSELHLLHAWRYLGSADALGELRELAQRARSLPPFDVDVYRLLSRALTHDSRARVVELPLHPALRPGE